MYFTIIPDFNYFIDRLVFDHWNNTKDLLNYLIASIISPCQELKPLLYYFLIIFIKYSHSTVPQRRSACTSLRMLDFACKWMQRLSIWVAISAVSFVSAPDSPLSVCPPVRPSVCQAFQLFANDKPNRPTVAASRSRHFANTQPISVG